MCLADLLPGGQEETRASPDLVAGAAAKTMNRPAAISARSISRAVWKALRRAPLEGRVLAVFRHACLLLLPGDEVVALVLSEIGNGPSNIVLEKQHPSSRWVQSGVFSAIEPGMAAILESSRLRIGEIDVRLGRAETWEPRPNWERLRQNRGGIEKCLPFLRAFAPVHSPEGSLLSLVAVEPDLTAHRHGSVRSATTGSQGTLQRLQQGWAGDLSELQSGGARLAGLGNGLTPAGDDFLMGVMLWAWLAHPAPERFCRCLLESCAGHTTVLSAAFLRAAAEGQCSASWHGLLAALDGGTKHRLAEAVTRVMSFGHTSGADALAGFIWMGLASVEVGIAQVMGNS
jgi:hypothetical protein